MVAGASGHVIARWGCVTHTAIPGRDLSEAESMNLSHSNWNGGESRCESHIAGFRVRARLAAFTTPE
jgi:hypothetical protein